MLHNQVSFDEALDKPSEQYINHTALNKGLSFPIDLVYNGHQSLWAGTLLFQNGTIAIFKGLGGGGGGWDIRGPEKSTYWSRLWSGELDHWKYTSENMRKSSHRNFNSACTWNKKIPIMLNLSQARKLIFSILP